MGTQIHINTSLINEVVCVWYSFTTLFILLVVLVQFPFYFIEYLNNEYKSEDESTHINIYHVGNVKETIFYKAYLMIQVMIPQMTTLCIKNILVIIYNQFRPHGPLEICPKMKWRFVQNYKEHDWHYLPLFLRPESKKL